LFSRPAKGIGDQLVQNWGNRRIMWIQELELRLESGFSMIRHIWIERQGEVSFDPLRDSTDVFVETDDGAMWSASFVTVSYLQRQMEMSREVARDINNMPPVRFVAIETPHVIIDSLDQETIEDTIDNMMTLGVFESVFVLHHAEDAAEPTVDQKETSTHG
jgi:nitrate reductase NapAB chaperone NapD